jgi:Ca2+-binding EF-hand superfamily protein
METMKKTLVIGCVLGLCSGSVALAHGFGGGLGRLDGDGDGKVTLAEMKKAEQEHFAKADANRDGRITSDEVTALREQMKSKRGEFMQKRFADKDADGDGRLSNAEVSRMPAEYFTRIYTNKDGFLSKDELSARANAMHEHFGERFEKRGERLFERADANKDGAVDANEADALAAAHFAKLDANHDGVIVKDELHHGRGGRDGRHQREGAGPAAGTAGSGATR